MPSRPSLSAPNAVNFAITNPVPVISNINPSQVMAGAGAIALTINGSGFVPNSIVRVNNADHPKTFVSARLSRWSLHPSCGIP